MSLRKVVPLIVFMCCWIPISPQATGILTLDYDTSVPIMDFSRVEIKSAYLPGAFQFRSILFNTIEQNIIVASSNKLYKLSVETLQPMLVSDWLPSTEYINDLVIKDNQFWVIDDLYCKIDRVDKDFDLSKITNTTKLENITCRWYFNSLTQTNSDTLWTCLSKGQISGCVEMSLSTLKPTERYAWPSTFNDPAFVGSFPETPWLTSWKSVVLVNLLNDLDPQFSFVGNKIQNGLFSVSSSINNRLFSKLFQDSETHPIKSFIIGQYQYIFFHDKANEARSSYYDFDEPEKEYRRYSRVGRVCVNSDEKRDNNFLVARLVCGIAKESLDASKQHLFYESAYDYQYVVLWDILTDIVFDEERQLFFATFNKHYLPKGLLGSSVCVYNLSDINSVLESGRAKKPRNKRADSHLSWELYLDPLPSNFSTCPPNNEPKNTSSQQNENFLPLMHDWVEPMSHKPIFYSNLYSFQSLAYKTSKVYTYLFIVTHSLNMIKLTWNKNFSEPKIETNFIITLPPASTQGYTEGLFDDNFTYFCELFNKSVYIGTTWTVYKVPQTICNTFQSCHSCLSTSKDPECYWNSRKEVCSSYEISGLPSTGDILNETIGNSSLCPQDTTSINQNVTYQITFLDPLPTNQLTDPILTASEVNIFCGAKFNISQLYPSESSQKSVKMDLTQSIPVARWYENSRDVSQVGKCGSLVTNMVSCTPSNSHVMQSSETNLTSGFTKQTITGFVISLLKVTAYEKANYTCVFHYYPKQFISDSVMVNVKTRTQHADQIYTEYLKQLREYYVTKCEIDTYCVTDGCKLDNEQRFHSCLLEQTSDPN